ncbi:hypothetical protein [Fodinibius sp.]|uniref:hypothetical protein n=1 Tax=Fodinibius sp. TaxID=1872440 RepID=UPI002ACE33A6|nr:hypothetical protein [Fodinibius sp.]MDZ7658706.1 hypothetical protein [Fodinibius sp.]
MAASKEGMENAPKLGFHLLVLPEEPDLDELRSFVDCIQSACVFVVDSGNENILP